MIGQCAKQPFPKVKRLIYVLLHTCKIYYAYLPVHAKRAVRLLKQRNFRLDRVFPDEIASYRSALVCSLIIMAGQGASLQNFNNELVKCIEDLREKREELNRQLLKDEEEKAKIQRDLSVLTDRLAKINESLARKVTARNEYDRTIQETEGAYMKILESSATLLNVLKRETVSLVKRKT